MQAFVGTSGWAYRHWQGRFYPAHLPVSQWLSFYAQHFPTVEINASFYGLPRQATFAAWAAQVPAGFRFAVKANRFITHQKKLAAPEKTLPPFLAALAGLGDHLGPLLFQLPPRFAPRPERLLHLLEALPAGLAVAFEFRDPRWHTAEIIDLLTAHGAAFCVYDLAGYTSPRLITTHFAYVRLHGPGSAYCGRYDRARLAPWAEWLREAAPRYAYVYFDNDEAAYAVEDARLFAELLAGG
jgi:uncharacterized protein YecE (DUF72 family)